MQKIWFIKIGDQQQGPYSIYDLKFDPRITPDTLARREGIRNWVAMRYIPELKELFKDEESIKQEEEESSISQVKLQQQGDELLLDMGCEPPKLLFWILILSAILTFMMIWQLR